MIHLCVLVTLFSTKEKCSQQHKQILTNRKQQIIAYLKDNDRITTFLCARFLDVSTDTALRDLSKLCSLGLIH